jgi:hypothetical protein
MSFGGMLTGGDDAAPKAEKIGTTSQQPIEKGIETTELVVSELKN